MKIFEVYTFIFWYCCTLTKQETLNSKNSKSIDSFKILTYILDTNIWKTDVGLRKTMFEIYKTPLTYDRLQELIQQYESDKIDLVNTQDETKKKEIEHKMNKSSKSVIFEVSKSMFLILKCKYSDIIIKSLQYVFEMLSLCNTINIRNQEEKCVDDVIVHFIHQKKYFVKIIFDLFIFVDKFPNLKYSDPILLMSLAVINLYMNFYTNYGKTKNGSSVRDIVEKKMVSQMINFLERFRCQKCIVNTNNYFEEYKKTRSLFQAMKITNDFQKDFVKLFDFMKEYLSRYSEKIVITSFEDSETLQFNEEMYDTKYLTFEYIFSDNKYSHIREIIVKNNAKKMTLNNMLENALQSYNIKTIFDFQKLFINVIIDLCHVQFHYFNDTYNCNEYSYLELQKLLTNVNVFIKTVLPNNYPLNKVNSLQKLYDTIQTVIFEYSINSNPGRYIITDNSILQQISVKTIVNWESYKFIKALPMSNLLQDIITHKYFNSFFRYFKLFLSEPNSLVDYRLYGVDDRKKTDGCACSTMAALRRNLFIFEVIMAKRKDDVFIYKQFNGTNLSILKATDIINKSLAHLYKKYHKFREITNILIPLSIRFKNASSLGFEDLNGLLLEQQSLLAANLLEHFEINNCPTVKLNVDMFLEILDDENMFQRDDSGSVVDYNQKYIVDEMSSDTQIPDEKDKYAPLSWVNKFIPNDFYKYYDSQFNSDVINWDGTEDKVDAVFLSTKQSVIDHNYLIRFLWFKLKWFVYNIFKKMLYIAVNRNEYYKNRRHETLTVIRKELLRFKNLPFPHRILMYLEPIFAAYDIIFYESDMLNNENSLQEIQNMIKKELKYLDVVDLENTIDKDSNVRLINIAKDDDESPKSLTFLRNEFREDYNFLETILNLAAESGQSTHISHDDFFYIY